MSLLLNETEAPPGCYRAEVTTPKQKNRNARFGRSGGTQPVRQIVTISADGEPPTSRKCAACTRHPLTGQGIR